MFDWVLITHLPTSVSMWCFCGEKIIAHHQSLASYFEIFSPFGVYSFTITETELNCNEQKLNIQVESGVA